MLNQVSIIIVTYKGDDVLAPCLESLAKACGTEPEIVVVDNSPSENTKALVEEYFNAVYVESPGNLGFAGGNNIGLQYCARKYVLLLNNDTIVRSGQSIKGLVEFLESHPDAGIAQGSIVLPKANGMAGLGVGSVPPRLIGTPTAGKSASLTFRLVRRASQPITISKMFLAASAMATPTSTSPSHNMLKYPHA